jgi:hypothetical protein
MLTFTSSARAGADTRKAAVAAQIPRLRMIVSLSGGLYPVRLCTPVRVAFEAWFVAVLGSAPLLSFSQPPLKRATSLWDSPG